MFDLINGLPVHPLVVHGVVVLLPLACLGTLLIAVRPSWRQRYGVLVVAITAVATVLIPISTSSGEALEKRVGDPGVHAELGDQLIWFAIPLLVLGLALVVLDRRRASDSASSSSAASSAPRSALMTGVCVLAVIASLAASVQVYRVGDSGAKSAWGDKVSAGSGSDAGSSSGDDD